MNKKIISAALAAILAISAALPVSADTANENETIVLIEEDDNEQSPTGWKTVNGKKYYWIDGKPVTKNTDINGIRYIFDSDGVCRGTFTGKTHSEGITVCYVDGILQTGWFTVKDKWYYAENSGMLRTGWVSVYENTRLSKGRKYYYFDEKGVWNGKEDHTAYEYEPRALKYFLIDFSYLQSSGYKLRYNGTDYTPVSSDDTAYIRNVLENNAGKKLLHDEISGDVIMSELPQPDIGKTVLISPGSVIRGERNIPSIWIYKDNDGTVYLYVGGEYCFGCALDDSGFYNGLLEIIEDNDK